MEHLAPGAKAAGYVGNTKHTCPRCHGNLIRTPRRFIDRLRSLFTPVQRYRCDRFSCRWVGNHSLATTSSNPFQKKHMFTLLNTMLIAALLLLVLLTAISASMSSHPTADTERSDALQARDNDSPIDANTDGSPSFQITNPRAAETH